MSDYEETELEEGEGMFGMSIKDDDDILDIDPLADDSLPEEEEDPLLEEEEEVGLFLEDGDEEEVY